MLRIQEKAEAASTRKTSAKGAPLRPRDELVEEVLSSEDIFALLDNKTVTGVKHVVSYRLIPSMLRTQMQMSSTCSTCWMCRSSLILYLSLSIPKVRCLLLPGSLLSRLRRSGSPDAHPMLDRATVSDYIADSTSAFYYRFESVFGLDTKGFSIDDRNFAASALSNLLGSTG